MTVVADILPGFSAETIVLPNDYDGAVKATLVFKKATVASTKAVLYIHGYCDYFFQTELAKFYNDKGFNFYALDLRKYGRSLLPGNKFNFCKSLSEYYVEIDKAISIIRTNHGNRFVLLNGHSTGGLLSALYTNDRLSQNRINALFLNSPFLDFNDNWFLESFLKTVVTGSGLLTPYLPVPAPGLPLYGESISAAYNRGGDQNFNELWKPASTWNPPVLAGWIRAIRLGHLRLQNGLKIPAPTLLMRSDKSGGGKTWNDSYNNSDCVLDVSEISKFGLCINKGFSSAYKEVVIKDGLHDLACSRATPRALFYSELGKWLTKF